MPTIMRVHRLPRHNGMVIAAETHPWYEFVYYISCEGTLTLGGSDCDIRPGRFVTIRPGTLHSEVHTADSMVFYCIFQSDIALDDMVFDDDAEHTILRLAEALYAERRRPRGFSEELQQLILGELLLRVMRWNSAKSEVRGDLAHAREVIEQNFREPIRLSQLASDIGYGYEYFRHRFRERWGISPKQYLMRCRIDAAKELLASGRYTCTEVAYLSGFSDSAQFSKIFARETGTPPVKWRQSVEK